MLTKEEIAVRVGIDASAVKSQLGGFDDVVENNMRGLRKKVKKFSGDILSGAVMGFVGQITAMASNVIESAVDKLSDYMSEKIYNTIYGISKRLGDITEEINKISNKAGLLHESAANEMGKIDASEERRIFEAKSAEERVKISEALVFQTQKEMNAAKAAVEDAKNNMRELRRLNEGNQAAAAEGAKKIAEAEEAVLNARKKNLAAHKDLRQAYSDIKIPAKENSESAANNGISPSQWTPEMGAPQFSFAQPVAAKKLTGAQAVADYMSKIKSAQDAYKAKTDYSQFGKAVAEAQAKAAAETVIPVRIVEIKD